MSNPKQSFPTLYNTGKTIFIFILSDLLSKPSFSLPTHQSLHLPLLRSFLAILQYWKLLRERLYHDTGGSTDHPDNTALLYCYCQSPPQPGPGCTKPQHHRPWGQGTATTPWCHPQLGAASSRQGRWLIEVTGRVSMGRGARFSTGLSTSVNLRFYQLHATGSFRAGRRQSISSQPLVSDSPQVPKRARFGTSQTLLQTEINLRNHAGLLSSIF